MSDHATSYAHLRKWAAHMQFTLPSTAHGLRDPFGGGAVTGARCVHVAWLIRSPGKSQTEHSDGCNPGHHTQLPQPTPMAVAVVTSA